MGNTLIFCLADWTTLNEIVDVVAIIEFLGLLALVGALWYQRKELQLQREQLKSQTEEFKKTAQAQEKYAKAMEESNYNTERIIALEEIKMHECHLESFYRINDLKIRERMELRKNSMRLGSFENEYNRIYNEILELIKKYSDIYAGGYISVEKGEAQNNKGEATSEAGS